MKIINTLLCLLAIVLFPMIAIVLLPNELSISNSTNDILISVFMAIGAWLYYLYDESIQKPQISKTLTKDIILCFLLIFLIDKILFWFFGEPFTQVNKINNNQHVIIFLSIVIVSPITEELCFRWLLLKQLFTYHSFISSSVLSTGLWTIMHYQSNATPFYYVALFISGIIFCVFVKKKNGLITVMIVHALSNLHYYLTSLINW